MATRLSTMRHRIWGIMARLGTVAYITVRRGAGLIIRRSQVQILQGPYRLSSPTEKPQTVSHAGAGADYAPPIIVVNGVCKNPARFHAFPPPDVLVAAHPLGIDERWGLHVMDGEGR
jgi:hypothetical protein